MFQVSSSRILLPILCLLAALGIFSTSLYLPSLPGIGTDLNASPEAVQLTLTLFFLGSCLGYLSLGPIADRMGRLTVAKGGLILFILTSLWCALAPDILSFQIARLFQGFAASSGPLVARAIGRDLYEGSRLTRYAATIMMVISISPAIAPVVGGYIEAVWGWDKNFYFLVFFGILLFIMVWNWLPETNSIRKGTVDIHSGFKSYISLLKDPYYLTLCVLIGLQLSAIFCYLALSPFLFINVYGWTSQDYGYAGAAVAVGNVVGFALARQIAPRLHVHQGIIVGSLLCASLSFIFVAIGFISLPSSSIFIVYLILYFGASALTVVNASSAAMNLFPQMAGASSALVGAIQIGSGAFGTLLATALPISVFDLALTMGTLSLIGLGAGFWLEKKEWLGR